MMVIRRTRKPPKARHTLYVREFPIELTRQVRAAALLAGVTINEMLAILVRDGLALHKVPHRTRPVSPDAVPDGTPIDDDGDHDI